MTDEPTKRRGGRAPGVVNKRTLDLIQLVEGRFPGYDPVLELIAIAREEDTTKDQRIACHKAIGPYMRPQIKSIELSGLNGEPLEANIGLSSGLLERLDQLASKLSGDAGKAGQVAGDSKATAATSER